jgi:hypothetical protein
MASLEERIQNRAALIVYHEEQLKLHKSDLRQLELKLAVRDATFPVGTKVMYRNEGYLGVFEVEAIIGSEWYSLSKDGTHYGVSSFLEIEPQFYEVGQYVYLNHGDMFRVCARSLSPEFYMLETLAGQVRSISSTHYDLSPVRKDSL